MKDHFVLPVARAHGQSPRQKTALLQAEIRKAVKRSVVAGSSFDRSSFRVIWSWQKRKLVCGLARSVIRCFLGSGVLPPDAHCTLSLRYVYRGINIQNS